MRYLKPFKENKLSSKDDKQSIIDITSSICDICDSYKLIDVNQKDLGYKSVKPIGYGLFLRFKDNGFIARDSQRLTKTLTQIFDELIEVESRLSDIGYYTFINFKDYGMTLGIYTKDSWDKKSSTESDIYDNI